MVAREAGYLLPEGPAYTAEMGCALVFYPDKTEYRRALLGALDYFGVWLAWETDPQKRGKDAARAWKDANDLTLECMQMNYCDEILSNLRSINNLLQQQHCCDGNNTVTYNETIITTTTIVPNQGDPPATWGESAAPADWDEWSQYVCYHAHLYVDYLIESAETLDTMISIGSWGIDFLAFVLGRLIYGSPGGIPVPVNFGWVNTISQALLGGLADLEFDSMAQKFEDSRQEILCAFMLGNDLEAAVESAVDSTLMWNVFYSWLDYESTVGAIYTGEVEGVGYLTPGQRSDCICVETPDYSLVENFTTFIPAQWDENVEWQAGYDGSMFFNNGLDYARLNKTGLNTYAGTSGVSYYCDRLKISWRRSTTNSNPYLKLVHSTGTLFKYWDTIHPGVSSYLTDEFFFDPPLLFSPGDLLFIQGYSYNCYGNVGLLEMDLWTEDPS